MSGKELDLALRVHADLTQGSQALETLSETIVGVGEGAQQANSKLAETSRVIDDLGASGASASQQLGQVGESAEQQAQRIQAMVAASLQAQAAIQGAVATNQRLDDSLKANNANWQESADSQTAAMNEYHNAERALAAQAVAQQQAAEQAAAAAEAFEEQEAALAKLLGQIDPVVRELGRLDQMEEQLRGFKASGILDPEGFDIYNAKVQEMRSRLGESADAMQDSAAATREQEAALARLQGQIDPVVRELNRLNQMEQQLRSFRDSGVLDQAGFDAYNRKLQEQRTRLTESSEAMRTAGMTAGQYRQAIQQLPAQLTDVATSLATGMPLWMVAIQQGGQITDSFGGISNILKLLGDRLRSFFGIASGSSDSGVTALGQELASLAVQQVAVANGSAQAGESLADLAENANTAAEATENAQKAAGALNGAVSAVPTNYLAVLAAVTPLALAIGVLSVAALKGIEDINEFNEALIASGNYAGKTTSQLIDLRNELAGGEHFSEAQTAILALVQDGRLAGDTFDAVAAAATEMSAATGKSAGDVAKQFSSARSDVVALAAELSSQYHVVTASTYEQIRALQEQGQSMDALRVLAGEVAGEMKRRNDEISESTRGIAKLWDDATAALGRYWAQLKSGLSANKQEFELQVLRQQVEDIDKGFWVSNKARDSLKQQYLERIAVLEKGLKAGEEERKSQQDRQEANAKYVASSKALNAELDKASPAKKRAAAIRDLNKEFMDLLESAERLGERSPLLAGVEYDGKSFSGGAYDELLKGVEDRYKDPKKPKPPRTPTTHLDNTDVTAAKNQLEQLQADFKNSQANLDAQQKAGLLSYSDYVAQRSDLIRQEKDAVTAAYQQQIAALEELRNKSTTNASQRIDLDQKIAQSRSDMVKAQKKADSDLSVLLTNEQGRLIKEAQAVKTYTDALRQQYDALVQQGARAAASVGMGANQRNLFEQQSNLDDRLAQQRLELASQYGDGARGMSLDEYNAKVQALESNHAAMTQQLRSNYAELQVAQADWTNGASAAFADYVDSANNAAGQTYQLFSNAFSGVEDALVKVVTTGKASFDDLLQTISADLARMAIRDLEADALKGLKNMLGGGQQEDSGVSMTVGAAAVSASATELAVAGTSLVTGAAAISAAAATLAAASGSGGVGAIAGAGGGLTMESIVAGAGAPSDAVSWPGAEAATVSADAISSASTQGAAAMGEAITAASSQGSGLFGSTLSGIFSGGADLFSGLFGSLFGGGSGATGAAGAAGGGGGWMQLAMTAASMFLADGGHVRGPGTSTSDSIPAMLSDNEFVTRAAVVRQPGMLPILHDINARGMTALYDLDARVRHATGGLAGVPAPAMPAPSMPGGRPADPASKLSANVTNRLRIINAQDPEDAVRRQAETPAFEKAVLNIIGGNPSAVKELLG